MIDRYKVELFSHNVLSALQSLTDEEYKECSRLLHDILDDQDKRRIKNDA